MYRSSARGGVLRSVAVVCERAGTESLGKVVTMSEDLGLLLVRLVLGGAIASHGAQKLFGWFGGYGIKGTGGYFESIGFRPGTLFATAAGATEFVGGVLIAVGFLAAVGPALVLSTMVVAMLSVHISNGFFAASNGIELPLVYSIAAIAVAFAGFGSLSIDAAIAFTLLATPNATWIVLAVGVLGAFANLALRRKTESP